MVASDRKTLELMPGSLLGLRDLGAIDALDGGIGTDTRQMTARNIARLHSKVGFAKTLEF